MSIVEDVFFKENGMYTRQYIHVRLREMGREIKKYRKCLERMTAKREAERAAEQAAANNKRV